MDRGSTGSGLTTAKRGKNQQAGNFRRLEPTTLVMGTLQNIQSKFGDIIGHSKLPWPRTCLSLQRSFPSRVWKNSWNMSLSLGKPSQEKTGNSLVCCQTGGTPPPLAKPKKFGNFRFFPGHFRGILKFLKYKSTCNEMDSVWYQEPVFFFLSLPN